MSAVTSPRLPLPSLSLCMIVKNEASDLERCLASVAGVADEVIVVDTGSTDNTVALAEAAGARVFHHAWQNDFSEARNFGLELATGGWILMLDADEELETGTRRRLKPWLAQTSADAGLMTVRSFTANSDLVRFEDLPATRLFRNRPEYRYEQTIHEQIRPSIERQGGQIVRSDLILWHYGYARLTAQGQQSRARRNLELLETALAAAPNDAYLHYQVGATYKSLGNLGQAEAHLRLALELGRQRLSDDVCDIAFMKLSQLAYSAKRYEDALQYARSSLEINPQNTVSLHISSLAALSLGDIKLAYTYFSRVQQQPDLSEESSVDVEKILAHLKPLL